MRLYVICPNTQRKIYLANVVEHRSQLMALFSLKCPYENGVTHKYSNNDVIAEPEGSSLTSGAVAGGLVGLLGGPIGIVIGGMIGAALGAGAEENEQQRVRRFG